MILPGSVPTGQIGGADALALLMGESGLGGIAAFEGADGSLDFRAPGNADLHTYVGSIHAIYEQRAPMLLDALRRGALIAKCGDREIPSYVWRTELGSRAFHSWTITLNDVHGTWTIDRAAFEAWKSSLATADEATKRKPAANANGKPPVSQRRTILRQWMTDNPSEQRKSEGDIAKLLVTGPNSTAHKEPDGTTVRLWCGVRTASIEVDVRVIKKKMGIPPTGNRGNRRKLKDFFPA